ncbi:hypothetical protein GCK72_001852 [Caenorhabditis remanei]|uniref:Uncharacterized protein n=2 Tax=Caenorhabditis remanei TaxID=31234 RepID=A0A6A5HR05_CAERE|nr:hypothetical protein GCK72_001852 [Caenorhabditis remanei]KAF1770035.1 hypothetical protein GCK72_001852 [Caenorhabditis remanei]
MQVCRFLQTTTESSLVATSSTGSSVSTTSSDSHVTTASPPAPISPLLAPPITLQDVMTHASADHLTPNGN